MSIAYVLKFRVWLAILGNELPSAGHWFATGGFALVPDPFVKGLWIIIPKYAAEVYMYSVFPAFVQKDKPAYTHG